MIVLEYSVLILLTLLAVVGWGANILGLPGNWLIVALALGGWALAPTDNHSHVTLFPLMAMVVVAALGELFEFAASALGASRMGGSKRGAMLAIVGSIAGALVGLFGGALVPIPIVGPVIASLLLGAGGAFAGTVVGERWAGKEWDASLQIGNAAFWGRLIGTVGKAVCGTIALSIYLITVWF